MCLWSNVQTQKPAIFSRIPKVVAARRHKDRDPIGRVCAEVIERGANEELERNGFKAAMDRVTLDVLLPGRGVPWVRFESDPMPDMPVEKVDREIEEMGPDGVMMQRTSTVYMDEDGEEHDETEGRMRQGKDGMMLERDGVMNERIMVDYVHWDDFAHAQERTWQDVMRNGWVARRVAMTKAEGVKRFGRQFESVPLTSTSRTSESEKQRRRDGSNEPKYGDVWEVWDAKRKEQVFVAKGLAKPLKIVEDPYGLELFFPCPEPAYATLTNEDLQPVPDYLQYASLAEELDEITGRIKNLTNSLKLVGVYDASAESIGTMLQSSDNTMIPVSNMSALVAKGVTAGGGLGGVVQFLPIRDVAEALIGLYSAREQVKQVLFEVSGVSDIVRGQVDPREKASQSKIKAEFAGQRLTSGAGRSSGAPGTLRAYRPS